MLIIVHTLYPYAKNEDHWLTHGRYFGNFLHHKQNMHISSTEQDCVYSAKLSVSFSIYVRRTYAYAYYVCIVLYIRKMREIHVRCQYKHIPESSADVFIGVKPCDSIRAYIALFLSREPNAPKCILQVMKKNSDRKNLKKYFHWTFVCCSPIDAHILSTITQEELSAFAQMTPNKQMCIYMHNINELPSFIHHARTKSKRTGNASAMNCAIYFHFPSLYSRAENQ